jgi:transposase
LHQIIKTLNADKKYIVELEAKVINLELINGKLMQKIDELLEKIEQLIHPKNSQNSSIAPSKDENRPLKNQSLRNLVGRKIGGQAGHQGSTLKMVENPNYIVDHNPEFCNCCGENLSEKPQKLLQRRQIIDIPPIFAEYTEHRIFEKTCTCGTQNKAVFPENVMPNISYGVNIQATIAYLHSRQYLPIARMSEFFNDFCNLPISGGTICNLLEKFTQKAQPIYDAIGQKIQSEIVVGSDETGIKINGKKGWFWAWQNPKLTYIAYSNNRGFDSIKTNFENGFPTSILVHDCWASQLKTPCKTHQICTAHLLRELVFFEQRYQSKWATDFKNLLYQGLKLKKLLLPEQYHKPISQRNHILKKLEILLGQTVPKHQKDLSAFHKRMTKYNDYIFQFLFHNLVPPDNNGSERAIRNVKVKQKISGQFKTETGAQIYAVIRSITDTCIKNNLNILNSFKIIANLRAE